MKRSTRKKMLYGAVFIVIFLTLLLTYVPLFNNTDSGLIRNMIKSIFTAAILYFLYPVIMRKIKRPLDE